MKARILQSAFITSIQDVTSVLSPVVGQEVHGVGQPVLIWEKLTNPRNRYILACREDPRHRGSSKSQNAIPKGCKEFGKNNLEADVV